MIRDTHAHSPNSLILVMDQTIGEIPNSMNQTLIAATSSCVAVGTICEADGETSLTLSDERPPRLPKEVPAFDGVIATPSRKLSICSVHDEQLLALDVANSSTRVRIWANHPSEPSEIWVVAGNDAI